MIQLLLVLALAFTPREAEPLKVTSIAKGPNSQIEELKTVAVRSVEEWTALWKAHAPDTKPPAVDFKQSMVLAVFAGTKPTAAFGIEIAQVDARESEVVVTYAETAPGPSDMVAQMLTTPFHIVRTDARAGKVIFKRAAPGR
jgi:hypothetical protein